MSATPGGSDRTLSAREPLRLVGATTDHVVQLGSVAVFAVALLGFGGFKHFGETVSGEVASATSDIGRIGLAGGHASGAGAPTVVSSTGGRSGDGGTNVGAVSAALEAAGSPESASSDAASWFLFFWP